MPKKNTLPVYSTDKLTANNNNKCITYTSGAAQLTLSVAGLGAGVLYVGPASHCAISPLCGKWLSDYTSEKFSTVTFAVQGTNFSLINAYMAPVGVVTAIHYIKKQETLGAKMGNGAILLSLTVSQNIPILIASITTSNATWQPILTVGGAVPGSLFGIVNLMDHELPYAFSKIRLLAYKMHYGYADLCRSLLTPEDKLFRLRMEFYLKQHAQFISEVEARWRYIKTHAQQLEVYGNKNPRSYLFTQPKAAQPSFFAKALHQVAKIPGLAFAAAHTAPVVSNVFTQMQQYIPTLPLQLMTTALFNMSLLYSNVTLTVDASTSIVDLLYCVLTGKPIESLPFQLGPKKTAVVALSSVAMAVLSYTVIETLFEKEFPGEDQGFRKASRISAMTGIDLYHLAGVIKFYHLIFSKMARNPKDAFFFAMENEVLNFKKMTLEQYTRFVEANDAETNALYGIQTYQDAVHENELNNQLDYSDSDSYSDSSSDEEKSPPKIQVVITEVENNKPSTMNTWANQFSATFKNPKEELDDNSVELVPAKMGLSANSFVPSNT